ncbi:MAG: IMP dehydrogenase [Candidatus Diapherotrites archaeon]|nr:IMP dehydrogenase [Candidatus Diapherotrites archaeon]
MGFKEKLEAAKESFAFDDFLLIPNFTTVNPAEANTSTKVAGIRLAIPILSAAMDTVTESSMAIELARRGGLGVVHRNFTIEEQVSEVTRVKRAESVIIQDVKTIPPGITLREIRDLSRELSFSTFPVVDNGKLVGIISNRDVQFERDETKKASELMTKELITAAEGTPLEKVTELMHKNRIEKVPVMKGERLVGIITVRDILSRKEYPQATRDKEGRLMVAAATGLDMKRVEALVKAEADLIVIDTAHGHNTAVVEFTRKVKKEFGCKVCAGNISTPEAAKDLIAAGADSLKVGVGPGSICTTRVVAGVGVAQLTAVANVADVAGDISVIADGGIRNSADVAKAIAIGANAVMVGNLLAGTDEAPGEIVVRDNKKYKRYRGMGSRKAVADRYFQEQSKFVPEGVEGLVPYKGRVKDILNSLVGGLRSSMGYTGAKNLKEMQQKARLIKITSAGVIESAPHDLDYVEESE